MLNTSLALSALVSTIIMFKLQLTLNVAFKVLAPLVFIVYVIFRFTSLGNCLKPSATVHSFFVLSYVVSATGVYIPGMALAQDGDPIGAAIIFYAALSFACFIQGLGLLILFFDAVTLPKTNE